MLLWRFRKGVIYFICLGRGVIEKIDRKNYIFLVEGKRKNFKYKREEYFMFF